MNDHISSVGLYRIPYPSCVSGGEMACVKILWLQGGGLAFFPGKF